MKKIKALGIAFVLAMLTLALYIHVIEQKLSDYYHVSDNSIRYNFEFTKYKGRDILKDNIDDKTLVVLGSSELGRVSEHPFHIKQLFNYDDFHIMAVGGGNFQNIIQASMLGSLSDSIPKQKFILSESFIWFDQYGMNPKAFLNRVSNEHVYYTLKNPKLSHETKEKFMNRILELSKDNKFVHQNFERYKRRLLDNKGTVLDDLLNWFDVKKFALNNKIAFYFTGNVKPIPSSGEKTPQYDWNEIQNKYDVIYCIAGLGGSIDHELTNINLIYKYENLYFIKENEMLFKIQKDLEFKNSKNTKISFIPFSKEIINLKLQGFKYNVENVNLKKGDSLCMSNVIISDLAKISFDSGTILCVIKS